MAKQKIHLKVGGKPYQMNIESDKEEIYRLAEREVNAAIVKLQNVFGDRKSTRLNSSHVRQSRMPSSA